MKEIPAAMAAKLSGAAAVIAERGLDESKMDDLASAAGVPKATLYYYFSGKEEILTFLLRDVLHRLTEEVAIATTAPGTAAERFSAVIRAQLGIMAEQPDVCRALVGDLGRAARMADITEMIDDAFIRPVQQLLDEGVRDGSLAATSDPRLAAIAVFGALAMTGLSHLVRGGTWLVEETASMLIELLTSGLAPRT